jgi:hypothetical protein
MLATGSGTPAKIASAPIGFLHGQNENQTLACDAGNATSDPSQTVDGSVGGDQCRYQLDR